jgi:hypothetical protein
MLNLKPDESVRQHFTDQKILTVYSMYILESVMFVRKNQSYYVTHEDFHFYNTKHKNYIVLPIHNNEFFKRKPSYADAKFMKYIPSEIQNIKNCNKFRSHFKQFLIKNAFYSLEEHIDCLKNSK